MIEKEDFKKLGSYKYSVVSFKPNLIADEMVNVGVELHDMETLVVHKKYTKNVKEINRRYARGHEGVKAMHELLFKFDEAPEVKQDKNYLLKKHEEPDNGYKRIFYREPYGGLLWNKQPKPEDALEHLYDMFVIIDKSEGL